MIPYTYAFASGLLPFDARVERRSGRTVHTRSTLSATRRAKHAANTAAEIAEKEAAREVPENAVPSRAPVPAKRPTERPYRIPKPEPKKRVIRTVSERDGWNLLRRIERNGGRDVIEMMRDSKQAPQELAERLIIDETSVIKGLDAYGSGKDRIDRVLSAVAQAARYLEPGERAVLAGRKKQKDKDAEQARQDYIAKHKKNPKVRAPVVPILADVVPARSDQQVMFDELRWHLEHNTDLRNHVLGAPNDYKAGRILIAKAGKRFEAKVKAQLAAPDTYQDLLVEAGANIRNGARSGYKASNSPATGVGTGAQQPSAQPAHYQAQQDALDKYTKQLESAVKDTQPEADDPAVEERRAIFEQQEAALQRFRTAAEQQPS